MSPPPDAAVAVASNESPAPISQLGPGACHQGKASSNSCSSDDNNKPAPTEQQAPQPQANLASTAATQCETRAGAQTKAGPLPPDGGRNRQTESGQTPGHKRDAGPLLASEFIIESPVKFEPLPDDNVNMAQAMLAAFRRNASRCLLVDAKTGLEFTGAMMLERCGSIASALRKQVRLETGQVVLMMCDHSTEEILLAYGVVLAGLALYGSSSFDAYEDYAALCQIVPPAAIATSGRLYPLAQRLQRELGRPVPVICLDSPSHARPSKGGEPPVDENGNLTHEPGPILYDHLCKGLACDQPLLDDIAQRQIHNRRHAALYLLTSGTTGWPKVVATSHYDLVYGLMGVICTTSAGAGGPDNALISLDSSKVLAGDLPLDHGAGVNVIFLTLLVGARLVVMPAYEPDAFWAAVSRHRVTTSVGSATFIYQLLRRLQDAIEARQLAQLGWLHLAQLELMAGAGSKVACHELIGLINQTLPNLYVTQFYGATEVGFISVLAQRDCRAHLDSVGYLMPGVRGLVIDTETGAPLGAGQLGELCLSSEAKFKGYHCHPSNERPGHELMRDCHLDAQLTIYKTGDQAHYDQKGRLYLHGRLKDTLFLAQDWKILPAEVERSVEAHAWVESAVVVGVPDERLPGCHAPFAFVKLRPEARGRPEGEVVRSVSEFVAEQCAEPKHLRGGVQVLADFPLTGLLNKIDRKALLAQALQHQRRRQKDQAAAACHGTRTSDTGAGPAS